MCRKHGHGVNADDAYADALTHGRSFTGASGAGERNDHVTRIDSRRDLTFGTAHFYGSTGGQAIPSVAPSVAVAMAVMATVSGYWIVYASAPLPPAQHRLAAKIAAYVESRRGTVSVAVHSDVTGYTTVYDPRREDTASHGWRRRSR